MDTTFLEEHGGLNMVHCILKERGCEPAIQEINEGETLLLSSRLNADTGSVGAYDFSCFESNEDELTYLFQTTLGSIDGEIFVSLLNLCNMSNARLLSPGTLSLIQAGEEGEWFLGLRFTFLTMGATHEVYEYVENFFQHLDEFFAQARWAFYEVSTGGRVEDAFEMLSFGETQAQA